MPAARSIEELQDMIMAEINSAMQETNEKAMEAMQKNLNKFYASPKPKRYIRTEALKRTPRVLPVSSVGTTSSFKFYLDKNHTYSTGNLLRPMAALLSAAEQHKYNIIGKGSFWGHSIEETKTAFYSAMGKRFR